MRGRELLLCSLLSCVLFTLGAAIFTVASRGWLRFGAGCATLSGALDLLAYYGAWLGPPKRATISTYDSKLFRRSKTTERLASSGERAGCGIG